MIKEISISGIVKEAELGHSKLSPEILSLNGMSSSKNRHLLNNLASHCNKYLEVGVWKGSTIISALYGNNVKEHFAIDNFSKFGGSKGEFTTIFEKSLGYKPNLFDIDCFSSDPLHLGIKDIDLYFYDGDHSEISQSLAITHFYSSLADEFIFIVDDINRPEVVRGTKDGIAKMGLVVEEEITINSRRMNDYKTWWNGLYIAKLKKG